ncbi:hypothetical protein SAMN05421670_3066 [Psychrobacillus psychrotolerans]|uniref:Uncharacterized protein n=1 Tax=Psychrobacillus psychrotolerans TaxID=126156 RepID=A0A1I6A1S3_9BACI|nr:hypothetical protein [Psychrobacillus psychrotolerans]SFQ62570.1 hypothetical protein SAMN05421670_3066 [Psychrobacillus psychrotolerans]
MRLALICPSNMLYMPYVKSYETILNSNNVDYDIISWDRFHIEDPVNPLNYRDIKIGHQRSYLDYLRYKKFIINKLNSKKYDKIIVFGIQISYFLKKYLLKYYKNKYILDIRDYNKIINFFNIKNIIENSNYTVLSSPGYFDWLPIGNKYLINHNTFIKNLNELKKNYNNFGSNNINIACIGALRDYQINIDLIKKLKNNEKVSLSFHGEGDINKDIVKFIEKKAVNNVVVTGRYNQEEEASLYINSNLINTIIPNNHINSKTLLPNRLYNAVLFGRLLLTQEGTYLAEQIKEYNLGIVISKSLNEIFEEIDTYLKEYDDLKYEEGRTLFFENVIKDNNHFIEKLKEFIK